MSKHINRNRHTIRLTEYDYSQTGVYFITIATYQHTCIFGDVINGDIQLNPSGIIAFEQWMH
ncbi:MAG: hypothetical protein A2030_06655 [Chloroflexi bacterium RBG_19FT_COMBO_50_10]|nr:MAG: hypothetical protein A2030_06655 [Chloroflexi bacterium RBG_19FT_COMBO_50_10]